MIKKTVVASVGVDSGQMAYIPFYGVETYGGETLKVRKNTKYVFEIETGDEDRVARSRIRLAGHGGSYGWVEAGEVNTGDAEQLIVSDPCYFENCGEYDDTTTPYGKACAQTMDGQSYGCYDLGEGKVAAVSSTGWGDGSYDMVADLDEEGFLVSVSVEFMAEEEDQEDEDDDDSLSDWDEDDEV